MATADWNRLGDINLRKFELYSMSWIGQVDIEKFFLAAAPYGGPIAVTKSQSRQIIQYTHRPHIYIFNAAGESISSFSWSSGRLIYMGWSNSEEILCIQDDGVVLGYDMFWKSTRTFGMGEEAKETKVIDCRIFNSIQGTGVAVLTSAFRIHLINDIDNYHNLQRLAEAPGVPSAPSCWQIVSVDGKTLGVMVKGSEVNFLERSGQYKQREPPIKSPVDVYTCLALSPNNRYLALFTESGVLWMGTLDCQTVFCEYDTKSPTKPKQFLWCGTWAVVACWDHLMLIVGPNKDWIKYNTEGTVDLVSEIDGVRIISSDSHEFLTKVPTVTELIFKIGSVAPGALLYEASKEYQRQSEKADEYVRLIKDQLAVAVSQAIEAAGHEYDVSQQKKLLRAASFGKNFLLDYKPDQFVDMCRKIRVLNAIREPPIAIPLTFTQLEHLSMAILIDRLVLRRFFPHAIHICQFLRIPDTEGASRILAHWACYMVVEHKNDPDEVIAHSIFQKLGNTPGISYSEIASKAIAEGRKDLAIRLLDYEPRASEQVPLLLQLNKEELALTKAIESGDADLIYMVLLRLKDTSTAGDFLLFIQSVPTARNLYLQYCKRQNRKKMEDLYYQSDNFVEWANCKVIASYNEQTFDDKMKQMIKAKDGFTKGKNDFALKQTDDQIKLLKYQKSFEDELKQPFVDASLTDTVHQLSLLGESRHVETLRKEFKIPDFRFWFLRVKALSEASDWVELEKFSKSKKSPIGYEPFVSACARHNNRFEAAKYLGKVLPENRVKCYVEIGKIQEAAHIAMETKNLDDLKLVSSKSSVLDPGLSNTLRALIDQLSHR